MKVSDFLMPWSAFTLKWTFKIADVKNLRTIKEEKDCRILALILKDRKQFWLPQDTTERNPAVQLCLFMAQHETDLPKSTSNFIKRKQQRTVIKNEKDLFKYLE